MHRFDYYTPATVAEAIDLLRTKGDGGKIFAGGTDLMPAMKERGRHPKYIVSLRNITDLKGISYDAQAGLRIKAATKMAAIQRDATIQKLYPVIVQGAKLIGSLQTQNLATLGGNIEVPTLDGKVTVTVPKGANSGQMLRLKGKGIKDAKSGKTGDQYVRLLIALPEGGGADLESFFRDRQETAARGAKE